jgi:GTPase SAR1 family protein
MAGSGKSSLTAAYSEWLRAGDQDVLVANLDPGATALPYNPDIDARKYVDIQKLMNDYRLGPNGALIMATDLLADRLEDMRDEIEAANPDILLVDTPGQIELFAFREGGRFITRGLGDERRVLIYLMDAPFSTHPLNFVSNIFLAAAIYSRINHPQIYVLSKIDLIQDHEADQIISWVTEPESFESALREVEEKNLSLITRNLADSIFTTGLLSEPIPVSSNTNSGFVELNGSITRLLTGGEEVSS